MVLTEAKKIIKDGLALVFILVVLIVGMFVLDKEIYLAPVLEIFLVLYVSFTGWSMFERERQEQAMEYALALPISRMKLFFLKLMVRMAAVFLMFILYHLVYSRYSIHFLLPSFRFVFLCAGIFLLSISLSLSMKSFLSTFFITLFISLGLYYFIQYLDYSKSDNAIALQAFLSLIAIPIVFLIFFQRFDIKPIAHFNRKYIPVLVVLMALVFGLTFMTTQIKWQQCYLTDDGYLVRVSKNKTVITRGKEKKQILNNFFSPLFEKPGKIYASQWYGEGKTEQLVRMDAQSGKIEKTFDIPAKYWFHDYIDTRPEIGDRIFFLLTMSGHKKYEILEINGNQSRIIPINMDFGEESFHMISGAAENPLQFFIFASNPRNHSIDGHVYRIFENGETERLFPAKSMAFWKNRLLRFIDQGMILYEAGKDMKKIYQRNGDIKKVRRKFENFIQKKVLMKSNGGFFLFDMEEQILGKINLKKQPYYYCLSEQNEFRLVWTEGPEISVSTWKNNHLQVEKVWYTRVEGIKIIRVFHSGIAVYNQKQHECFYFEDSGGGEQNHNP